MSLSSKKILIGITGSIAAYKACEVISSLKKQGADVRVIATPSALEFVGKATLEGLTGNPVGTGDFVDGAMMSHITLAKWSDVFLIVPASAQTLNAFATGVGSGLLMSTYLASNFNKPLWVAPAMNTQMWQHPTTQKSIAQLQEWGAQVLWPEAGDLACGDIGEGRLLAPEKIVQALIQHFQPSPRRSILITAGGTRVPIDSVRSITNTSTGETGRLLADELARRGYHVDLLLAVRAQAPQLANTFRFDTYDDLAELMQKKLSDKKYDLVIHAAAVSDFKVETTAETKLSSRASATLQLTPTIKLLGQIKQWCRETQVVGFKLTNTPSPPARAEAIERVFAQGADWVVHNDLSEIKNTSHHFTLYSAQGKRGECERKSQLASLLAQFIFTVETPRGYETSAVLKGQPYDTLS